MIIFINMASSRASARDAARFADARQIMNALQLFYQDNNGYPLPTTASTSGPTADDGTPAWSTFLAAWPQAPQPNDGSCTADENTYTYTQTNNASDFTLTFCLGKQVSNYSEGVHTASADGIQ